ncbi:elongation factor G [Lactobacillus intestinalis]|uniref:elongation factor G n=1 Tax=Lactobacillus intestinalis TaxID=151781 RepID=UPI00242F32D0|nr:TetM/TetW/TetO/TetS family tetracycline resistance ribosomal protection protein [Lactobacillus intestinalis]
MKHITLGIVAHVDAGKTTLSESLMYKTGNLRKLGRVDNGDAFLDPDELEKKRGITIFSHNAKISSPNFEITLLDTPGHIDFASQTIEALGVLDYAILVVSALDGVTGYTKQLWNLLKKYQIPAFIFVNKMDIHEVAKTSILKDLQENLDANCIDFMEKGDKFYENVATTDENLLDKYLNGESIEEDIPKLVAQRKIFPVYFGSALKLDGIDDLLQGLEKWSIEPQYENQLQGRVHKITHDQKGERLTWMKLLGGNLKPKEEINGEKINQIRSYNGEKYDLVNEMNPGQICALVGLTKTYPGQGIGLQDLIDDSLKPVLVYKVETDVDIFECLNALRQLEDEDPLLHVDWVEELQEIHVEIMGEVQREILKQIMKERFNLDVDFVEGNILYKETITNKIEAVGHFEPLRHYSEVHFLLEPGAPNSGLVFENKCDLEVLSKNWQEQIMTALESKTHLGVLTGSPITDMKVTLIGGRGSNVHTVGGDFREATSRGVRQGLMELKSKNAVQLLEPWYEFELEIPQDQVGRALNDIQKMSGKFDAPENLATSTIIKGRAPVSEMISYSENVRNYTHGQGRLQTIFVDYYPCHNKDEIIEKFNYDPMSDLENTPNSVFCSHGAGHTVVWNEVPSHAQYPYTYKW